MGFALTNLKTNAVHGLDVGPVQTLEQTVQEGGGHIEMTHQAIDRK